MSPHPPTSTLFPYTTLFRSAAGEPSSRLPASGTAASVAASASFNTTPSLSRVSAKSAMLRARVCTAERSEEHTSELQSQSKLVCRLQLEKKKTATVVTVGVA